MDSVADSVFGGTRILLLTHVESCVAKMCSLVFFKSCFGLQAFKEDLSILRFCLLQDVTKGGKDDNSTCDDDADLRATWSDEHHALPIM